MTSAEAFATARRRARVERRDWAVHRDGAAFRAAPHTPAGPAPDFVIGKRGTWRRTLRTACGESDPFARSPGISPQV